MSVCPGHARHWFIEPRTVGLRRPDCARCGAANPRKLTEQELNELASYRAHVAGLHGQYSANRGPS